MFSALVPVLMILLGALIYGLSSNPKVAELGRILFAAGCFALGFFMAGRGVSFG